MKVYELSYDVHKRLSIYEYDVSRFTKNSFICDDGDKESVIDENYEISGFLLSKINKIISCKFGRSEYYNLIFIDSKSKERQIKRFEKFILNSVDD